MKTTPILVDHRQSGYYWRLEHEKVDMGRGPFPSQGEALESAFIEIEARQILEMSDEQVMAKHLANFDGNTELAEKSVDMMQARIEGHVRRVRKQ